jgi:hypothetical protein
LIEVRQRCTPWDTTRTRSTQRCITRFLPPPALDPSFSRSKRISRRSPAGMDVRAGFGGHHNLILRPFSSGQASGSSGFSRSSCPALLKTPPLPAAGRLFARSHSFLSSSRIALAGKPRQLGGSSRNSPADTMPSFRPSAALRQFLIRNTSCTQPGLRHADASAFAPRISASETHATWVTGTLSSSPFGSATDH